MFYSPWFLLLLLLLPVIGWRLWSSRSGIAIPFSSTHFALGLRRTWRQRLAWLPAALTLCAVAVTIIALARPREGREQTVVDSEGIAIEMLVDLSGSMHAMDFKIEGQHVDRLTAIKNVAGRFVLGDDGAKRKTASAAAQAISSASSHSLDSPMRFFRLRSTIRSSWISSTTRKSSAAATKTAPPLAMQSASASKS